MGSGEVSGRGASPHSHCRFHTLQQGCGTADLHMANHLSMIVSKAIAHADRNPAHLRGLPAVPPSRIRVSNVHHSMYHQKRREVKDKHQLFEMGKNTNTKT